MDSIETLKQDVSQFVNSRPVDESRPHDIQTKLEDTVKQEVAKAEDIVFTNGENHTDGMVRSVLSDPLQGLNRWHREKVNLSTRVNQFLQDNCTSQHDTAFQKLRTEKEQAKAKTYEQFSRENGYAQAKNNRDTTTERYNRMNKEQGGKPPVKANLFLYAVVILLVGGVEVFLNYSTLEAKYAAPGIAVGGTLIIALCFAFASHFHGGFLKQRIDLVGPDVEARKKRQAYLVQGVATLLFVIALAAVSIIRYQVLQDELSVLGVSDQISLIEDEASEPPQSAMGVLLPFILMNTLVWIIGIFISYLVHDARPSYQEAYKDMQKANTLFNKLDLQLQAEYDRLEAKFKKDVEAQENTSNADRGLISQAENLKERIETQYDLILQEAKNTLNRDIANYQNMLVTCLKSEDKASVSIGAKQYSVDDYLHLSLALEINTLKSMIA